MSSWFIVIALLIIVFISINSRLSLRMKIRRIIKKHPNTIRYLKNKTFKEHELIKSLKGKVYDELSDKNLCIARKKLETIIEQEIVKVLKGWKRKVLVFFGVLAGAAGFCFAALLVIGITTSDSKKPEKAVATAKSSENSGQIDSLLMSAETHIGKSEYTLAKTDLDQVLRLDPSSQDATKLLNQVKEKLKVQQKKEEEESKKKLVEAQVNKNEEHFNNGIAFMNDGQEQKAIKEFEMVNKSSNRYEEAQKYISNIKRNKFDEQCKDIDYKELKKSPEEHKGEKIHFAGKIFNIQEVSGKTILSLATAYTDDDYYGDDVFILFPTGTSLVEGDFIDIYGEMVGNYSKSQSFISDYLNGSQYSIYYDGGTFYEQAPVIKARLIEDSNKKVYGK
ncbi:hypothetical protein ACIQXV_17185 [Neobacillus sp. NPDC097160]|uniref:hypothetical protein n=1 Tax=Neobacillus sp. NPDC097160 TaxID=3364298 RepID=UPI00381C1246